MKAMPARRVDPENNVSGNALWQRGYITLVNLKLTSEHLGERETTDSKPLPNNTDKTRIQLRKLICHPAGIRPYYFKGRIKGTF